MSAPLAELPLFRETEVRDRVLDHLELVRAGYVARLRERVAALYHERRRRALISGEDPDAVYVTSTDVREAFESMPNVPSPEELNRNFLGSVFRGAEWESVGVEPSETPGRRGALIRRWRHVGLHVPHPGPGERGSERPRSGRPPAAGDAVRPGLSLDRGV